MLNGIICLFFVHVRESGTDKSLSKKTSSEHIAALYQYIKASDLYGVCSIGAALSKDTGREFDKLYRTLGEQNGR